MKRRGCGTHCLLCDVLSWVSLLAFTSSLASPKEGNGYRKIENGSSITYSIGIRSFTRISSALIHSTIPQGSFRTASG